MNLTFRNIVLTAGVLLLAFSFWYFSNIVAYILISLVLSLIGRPIIRLIQKIPLKKHTIPTSLAAGITLIVIWIAVIISISIFIPLLINEAQVLSSINVDKITQQLEKPVKDFEIYIKHFLPSESQDQLLKTYISKTIGSFISITQVSELFSKVSGVVGNIFIAIFSISFITFFFLKEEKLFSNALLTVIPQKHNFKTKKILVSTQQLLIRYFIGLIVEVLIVITLITTGLTMTGIGFQHALVIGFFAGLMNIIPYIGPIVGALLGIVIGFALNIELGIYPDIFQIVIYMGIVFLITQLIDNILLQPLIYSNSVQAHPLEIFIVIMIAGSLAGITGMILAIPSYTILRVVARETLTNFRVIKELTKGMN